MASALAAIAATKRILEFAAGIDSFQQSLRALAKDQAQATKWFERLSGDCPPPGISLAELDQAVYPLQIDYR